MFEIFNNKVPSSIQQTCYDLSIYILFSKFIMCANYIKSLEKKLSFPVTQGSISYVRPETYTDYRHKRGRLQIDMCNENVSLMHSVLKGSIVYKIYILF